MFNTAIIVVDPSRVGIALSTCAEALREIGVQKVILAQCITMRGGLNLALSYDETSLDSQIEQEVATLRERGFQVEQEVLTGSPGKNVRKLAKKREATLVVTGTDHHSIAEELLGKDISWSILEHSQVPVLLLPIVRSTERDDELCVHPSACKGLLRGILFPTDFSENADIAFPVVEGLSGRTRGTVVLMHVQDSSRIDPHLTDRLPEFDRIDGERLDILKTRLEQSGSTKVVKTIRYGKPVTEILNATKEYDTTLVVMGRHGRGFVAEAILGSVSHTVVHKGETPLLLVP